MKRAFFLYLILASSLLSFGQSRLFDRNVEWHETSTETKIIAMSDGSWISAGNNDQCFNAWLIKRNAHGDTLWTNSLGYGADISDIKLASNGVIYAVGAYIGADDVFADDGTIVIIYDTTGNLIDLHIYIKDSMYFASGDTENTSYNQTWAAPFNNGSVAYLDSNSIVISVDSDLVKINPRDWSVTWSKHTAYNINDILVKDHNIYLAAGSGLMLTDTTGIMIGSIFTYGEVLDCYLSHAGKSYFLGTNGLFAIDTSLSVTNSYGLAGRWKALTGNSKSIFVLGNEVAVFDSNLVFQNQFPLIKQCSLPFDIAANDSIVGIITTVYDAVEWHLSYPYYLPKSFMRTYDFNGASNISSSQVQVIKGQVDSIQTSFRMAYGGDDYFTVFINSTVTIKNIGTDTIHQISLHGDIFDGMNCAQSFYFHDFKNIVIAPQDTFDLVNLNEYNGYYVNQGKVLAPIYYVTSINQARPNDNCNLQSITLPSYTVTGINELALPTFHIYPNPATNILNIESNHEIGSNTSIYITDLTGKVLLQRTLTDNNTAIDISSFAMGLYIYSIKDGTHNPVTGKIEKL